MGSSEWKEVKLGEIANVLSGYAFKSKDFKHKGVPVIKIKNIVPPYVVLNDLQYVSNELADEKKRYELKYNDVLISLTGSNVNQLASAVGKVGRVKQKNQRMMLNQRVGKFEILDDKEYDLDFLYYLISTDEMRFKLASNAGGAANQANISPSMIKEIILPCPFLPEQKAIAATLSCLDDKIELNNRINKTLEQMAQAIFKRWFVDFEPFQDGEFEDSELGRIPKGWQVEKLSNVITVKDGTHDSPKPTEYGYPLVTSKHLKSYEINFKETYLIGEEDYFKINKRSKVERHDVLISMIGTIGNICYILYDDIFFAIKNIGLFKTSERKELAEYILFYLKSDSIKEYIESRLAGSTQKYISLTELRKIPILIPPESVLSSYKNIIETVLDYMHIKIQENQALITIRDTLLPKLMSGEIRVPIEEVQ